MNSDITFSPTSIAYSDWPVNRDYSGRLRQLSMTEQHTGNSIQKMRIASFDVLNIMVGLG